MTSFLKTKGHIKKAHKEDFISAAFDAVTGTFHLEKLITSRHVARATSAAKPLFYSCSRCPACSPLLHDVLCFSGDFWTVTMSLGVIEDFGPTLTKLTSKN